MIRYLFAFLLLAPFTFAAGTTQEQSLNTIVCGPRCVQFVLKHFGQEVELAELVREMQWPQLTEGATAASVIAALENRGVFVKAIQVDPKNTVFVWEHPMIVHLKPSGDGSLGHFVVRMPQSADEKVAIFDGLAGLRTEPSDKFSRKMSGVVLLCSPTRVCKSFVGVCRMVG